MSLNNTPLHHHHDHDHDQHSFYDSFTSHQPFIPTNLPTKFSAKHLKLLSFLKWFHDNNLNLPDFHNTLDSLHFLHRFLDFESGFTKRFKSFLKLNNKNKNNNNNNKSNNNNNNNNIHTNSNSYHNNNYNNNLLQLSNTTNVDTNESKLIDTEIINIDDTDY